MLSKVMFGLAALAAVWLLNGIRRTLRERWVNSYGIRYCEPWVRDSDGYRPGLSE